MSKMVVRVGVWLALLVLVVVALAGSAREHDYVADAMKQVPEGCDAIIGVWRDTDWPEPLQSFRRTIIVCDAESGARSVIIVFDASADEALVYALDSNHSTEAGDVFTVNPDGSLAIGDEFGEIKTLPGQ